MFGGFRRNRKKDAGGRRSQSLDSIDVFLRGGNNVDDGARRGSGGSNGGGRRKFGRDGGATSSGASSKTPRSPRGSFASYSSTMSAPVAPDGAPAAATTTTTSTLRPLGRTLRGTQDNLSRQKPPHQQRKQEQPPQQIKGVMKVRTLTDSLSSPPYGSQRVEPNPAIDDDDDYDEAKENMRGSITFGDIYIREYARTIGDNPSCSSGPPVSISWDYDPNLKVLTVDQYETIRPPRRSSFEMVLPRDVRQHILKNDWDVTQSEIAMAVRTNIKIKNQRRTTVNNLDKASVVEEMMESAGRKLKRSLFLKKSCSKQVADMQKQALGRGGGGGFDNMSDDLYHERNERFRTNHKYDCSVGSNSSITNSNFSGHSRAPTPNMNNRNTNGATTTLQPNPQPNVLSNGRNGAPPSNGWNGAPLSNGWNGAPPSNGWNGAPARNIINHTSGDAHQNQPSNTANRAVGGPSSCDRDAGNEHGRRSPGGRVTPTGLIGVDKPGYAPIRSTAADYETQPGGSLTPSGDKGGIAVRGGSGEDDARPHGGRYSSAPRAVSAPPRVQSPQQLPVRPLNQGNDAAGPPIRNRDLNRVASPTTTPSSSDHAPTMVVATSSTATAAKMAENVHRKAGSRMVTTKRGRQPKEPQMTLAQAKRMHAEQQRRQEQIEQEMMKNIQLASSVNANAGTMATGGRQQSHNNRLIENRQQHGSNQQTALSMISNAVRKRRVQVYTREGLDMF